MHIYTKIYLYLKQKRMKQNCIYNKNNTDKYKDKNNGKDTDTDTDKGAIIL